MRIVFTLSVIVVVILAIGYGSITSFAQSGGPPRVAPWEFPSNPNDRFGAIAYSTSTGKSGSSWNFRLLGEAYNRALEECARDDCEIATWFKNACGALAVGDNGCWEAHWGANRSDAEAKALNSCNQRCERCRIISSPCTDH